ncbi:hypothetical protein JANAI62_04000 [Jannaschia pagri]|uniref:Transcriptional regulator, AlpA family n=1 Tax=Jannaschia pagri TaxID=2829797 RepID=A0ABQ4NI63_9RHOB|nr:MULTISPECIES: hypothetical protein [unclassified Jannaschia]GIT90117.1 hypothetical protein JANAI61_05750 [Jannaschia sp. AI_61]GIT93777.1 hypothetical protein JANAI62_04000 [Jannaschia sp. AI_62]
MDHETDQTFSRHSSYGSKLWVATRLGRSVEWLRKRQSVLKDMAFPALDPATGLYLKADVQTWVENRRKVSPRPETVVTLAMPEQTGDAKGEPDYDNL